MQRHSLRYKQHLSLQNQNLFFILIAKFSSDFGAFMNMVAISSYVYFLSNSPLIVGFFLAARVFAGMLASLVANSIYKGFKGKLVLVICDLIRAASLTLLLLLPQEYHLNLIPLIGFMLGLTNSWFNIGLNSQLMLFVGKSNLGKANAWITSLSSIGMIVGALSSGLLIALLDYSFVFMLNIASYLIAALFIALLTRLDSNTPNETQTDLALKPALKKLSLALKDTPILQAMLVITLVDTLGSASHNVGFPIIAKVFDDQSPAQAMGYIISIWAVGKLLGAFLSKTIGLISIPSTKPTSFRRMEMSFLIGVILMSSGFIFAFNQTQLLFGLFAFFIAGVGDGISEVCFITRAQQTSNAVRLPLFSCIAFMQNTGFGVGMLFSAMAFEHLDPGMVVGLFHGLPILAVLLAYLFNKRSQNSANHLDTREKLH